MSKTLVIGTVVVVVGAFALGGLFLWWQAGLRPSSPAPSPQPAQQTPPPAPSPQTIEGWQTYRSEEFGFEFQYPSSYTISPSMEKKPCFLIARQESACALALVITADNNDYTPKGGFYLVQGISFVEISGQVHIDTTKFDAQRNAWTLFYGEILQTWDYTNFGDEIIKTSNGGSGGNADFYIVPDYANDVVAIFMVPRLVRLRCGGPDSGIERDAACESFYQSVTGESPSHQMWLGKEYFNAVYKDAERMISTFRFGLPPTTD